MFISKEPAFAVAPAALRGARAATLAVALLAGASGTALAAAASPAPAPAPAPAPTAEVDEVVVSATPSVLADIRPDAQLTPEDVQALGVGTASEVLEQLSNQTQSASGEAPVILLNGRQVSGPDEIADIPSEAIRRVEVLPEEASLAFGYSGSQRVVNIVLEPVYTGKTIELGVAVPTEGGRLSRNANGSMFRLQGEDRVNLSVRYSANSALTEDERDLISRSTTPFSIPGNVVGTGPDGEIDPALSALAGRPVTVAGAPAGADRPLGLSDFTGPANPDDSGPFRTLLPQTRQLNVNGVVSKALGDFTATLNGGLGFNQSRSMRGLPSVALTIPSANPFSPFSRPTTLDRYVTGLGPLQQASDSWNGRLAANVRRDFGSLRTNLTANYQHNDNLTVTGVGVDATGLQSQLNAGSTSFNPFGPLPSLALRPESKGRSLTDSLDVRLLARTPLFRAPAGQVTSSFRVSNARSWINSQSQRLGVNTVTELSRNVLAGQANLNVPLTSRRNDFLSALGDLSINGNVGIDDVSDFGSLTTVGAGLNWSPITPLQLRVSFSSEERAPSLGQLNNPLLLTPASRVFDYVTGQTVDVTTITGGNRNLRAERRDVTRLSMNFKPFSRLNLNFIANYTVNHTINPVQSFPAVTAEIQAAFPERFVRDAAGNLLQFDTRPVNFAREDIRQLRWGFNFTRRLGSERAAGGGGGSAAQGPRNFAAGGARPGGQRAGGQGGPGGQGAQDFVALAALADADRNGVVTKQEWLAVRLPEVLFTRIDDNNDGSITRAEMAALPARAAAAQQGGLAELTAEGQDGAEPGQNAPGQEGPAAAGAAAEGPGADGPGPGARPLGGPEGPARVAQGPGGPGQAGPAPGPGGPSGPGGPGEGPVMRFPGGAPPGFEGRPGGGFGGGGFGGGGPGGGGRGGGGGGDSVQLSVFHTVFFENKLLARPGVPVFDRLNGSAAGNNGGRPRHQVQVEAGYSKGPFGARLNANWQSSTYVAGTGAGNLFFSDLTTANLRLFLNFGQMRSLVQSHPLLENTRLTLLVNNVLNERQRVTDANGTTPLSYQPGYVDPLGRQVRLELRKQF